MKTFYFTHTEQPRKGSFAKVICDKITTAIITAIYPYKRTGEELSLGLKIAEKEGVDLKFAYVHIQSNGTVSIAMEGKDDTYTEYEVEKAFLSYCQNTEYYDEAKELALKYGLIEYNHETDEQKSRIKPKEDKMNRLFFTFNNDDEYFAKTTEIDNQTKAIITALYPYIKVKSSFTFNSISISNQAPNDEMEYITVRKNNNGVVDIEGRESLTGSMCERIFIDNCVGVEYYGATYDLAKKLNLAFVNDSVKYADNWEKQARDIKDHNIECHNETPKFNDLSFNIMSDICDEIISTLEKKNDDYGNSYIKNIERFGKQAMLIPMFNKLDRLESLSKKENQNFESFEDSLRDLMGYCLMAIQHLIKTRGK